jgi:restriction system-associated AAA family ATPase
MKILRLQINNSFRSLPAGFNVIFRNPDDVIEKHLDDPICLVGVNGSGKSNVLEALAEIFSYIDQTFLNFVLQHSDSPIINSFELEYLMPLSLDTEFITMDSNLPLNTKFIQIKITKENDGKPMFYWINDGVDIVIGKGEKAILPSKIIGYSSGQNELLSIPFNKIKFRYYNNLLQEQKTTYRSLVEQTRLQYIDYDENANILLANYLMAKSDEVDIFKDQLLIDNISNFEIIINSKQKKRGVIKIDKEIDKLLHFFESNASTIEELGPGIVKLHFEITPELKMQFQNNFLDAEGLYLLFKKLGYLNLNSIKKNKINLLLLAKVEIYDDYKIVEYTPEKKLFKISNIAIKKSNLENSISYRNLSDGEHQFIHIIGTLMIMKDESALFLFDEPETHFNPKWKYEYFETFKKVINSNNSQILLTTHDPVLISGLSKENVIVFNKPSDENERTYKSDRDLKGMGVDALLTSEIFGLNSTLDIQTMNEIVERRKLMVKKESQQLSAEENARLTALSERLMEIDFNKPFADPLYRDFIMAIDDLDIYKDVNLNSTEVAEREQIAKEIMKKLEKNGF